MSNPKNSGCIQIWKCQIQVSFSSKVQIYNACTTAQKQSHNVLAQQFPKYGLRHTQCVMSWALLPAPCPIGSIPEGGEWCDGWNVLLRTQKLLLLWTYNPLLASAGLRTTLKNIQNQLLIFRSNFQLDFRSLPNATVGHYEAHENQYSEL